MKKQSIISRRDFIRITGLTGSFLALGSYAALGNTPSVISATTATDLGLELNAYIFIDESGKISIASPRPEIGQGVYQSIPMLVAEELEVDMNEINIVPFGGDEKRFGRTQYASGSSSIKSSWLPLRKLGASVKHVLIQAAANRWNISSSDCYASNGAVFRKGDNRRLSYGELVEAASKLEAPKDPVLKNPSEFKVLGKSLPRRDIPLKVNGAAKYGIDLKVEGMLYASVEYCPTIDGKLKSFNSGKALGIAGVQKVMKTQMEVFRFLRDGVAVIADSYWAAFQGRKALEIEWDLSGSNHFSEKTLASQLRETESQPGVDLAMEGNLEKFEGIQEKGSIVHVAEYECPFEAHATMEPMNCIVSVKGDACEFWGGTQGPGWFRDALAGCLAIPKENIKVNSPFVGGGFGRRGHSDFVCHAAMLSRGLGTPVKLIWTREDDMMLSLFRPATYNKLKGVTDKSGIWIAMQNKMVIQDLDLQDANPDGSKVADWIFDGAEQPYAIPNINRNVKLAYPSVPVGYWRSVYASTNTFCMESFVDEMAALTKKDPMEYRLALLKDQRRSLILLQLAKEKSNWTTHWKKRMGIGMAYANIFGSHCCQVVKVSRVNKTIKVDKVIVAFDCGMMVNPDTVRAQIEGNIVMALGAACMQGIHFKNGEVVERNFDSYRMPRIGDIPEIEIHIVSNEELPGGVGEPALPPFAPALANAIFNLTGKRIRKLPIELNKI